MMRQDYIVIQFLLPCYLLNAAGEGYSVVVNWFSCGFDMQKESNFHLQMIESKALNLLRAVSRELGKNKITGYLVGGFVRDTLLGRAAGDIDIAVNGNALLIGEKLAATLRGKFVVLDAAHKIGRLVFPAAPDTYIDISSFSRDIEKDLVRRDFTINAMAVDLKNFRGRKTALPLVDPYQGMLDLDRGIIRAVNSKSLTADPVRLLRAARFAAELGFSLEPKTRRQLRRRAALLAAVPGERVREELLKLLTASRGGQSLQYLDELGLLTVIFPELEPSRGITQPAEHHWDVLTHSLQTVSAVDYILGYGQWEYAQPAVLSEVPWTDEIAAYFEQPVAAGSSRRALLKLAALLHDIAKPQTKTIEPSGKMRFLGHNEDGARVVSEILSRLRFSVKEINLVANVVKYHLRPNQMGELPSRRAVYRFFRDAGDAALDVLYISLADHLATRGPGLILPNWRLHTATVRHIMEEFRRQQAAVKPRRLVDGNDLIKTFGLEPGPRLGKILARVKEAQATGELTNRRAALHYIRKQLAEGKK